MHSKALDLNQLAVESFTVDPNVEAFPTDMAGLKATTSPCLNSEQTCDPACIA